MPPLKQSVSHRSIKGEICYDSLLQPDMRGRSCMWYHVYLQFQGEPFAARVGRVAMGQAWIVCLRNVSAIV